MKTIILTLLILAKCCYCFSCDCVTQVGLKEAKSVFEGKVIGVEKIEMPYIYYQIKFRVSKVIKGKIKLQTIIVNTLSLTAGGCGIPFSINEKYIVYTYIEDNKLCTGDCTNTKKIVEGQ